MQAVQKYYYRHFFFHLPALISPIHNFPKKNMDDAETHLDLAIMHLVGV